MEQETVYKTMKSAGTVNLVLGIATIIVGIAAGIIFIINGAKLLTHKSNIIF